MTYCGAIQDTFEGVKYLHTQQPPICHGDLKSLNILVSSSCRAIIIDFGSARAISDSQDETIDDNDGPRPQGAGPTVEQDSPAIHVGTAGNQLILTGPAWSLHWAAPEMMSGNSPGLPSDIWAAGWVCWELMTDKLPFPELSSPGGIIMTVVQQRVPKPREESQLGQIVALCSLMTDCWAFDPKSRPSITQCCNRLKWMPSTSPSGGNPSGSKEPSVDLLLQQGQMHYEQDSYEEAASLFQQALLAEESHARAQEIYASIGHDSGQLNTLLGLGLAYRLQSKYTEAEKSFTRAHEISARLGNDLALANTLRGLGQVYRVQSKYIQAEETFTQAEEIYARIGDDLGRAYTLKGLGDVYRFQSKYGQAAESYTRAQEISARVGDDLGRANTLRGLGDVYLAQSKYTQAEESYTQAQEIYGRIGGDLGRANTLRSIGHLCRNQGRNVEAAAHYTGARELFARLGIHNEVEDVSRWLPIMLPDPNSSTTSPHQSVDTNIPSTTPS
ncbi:hypothetical protein M407DRAFT_26606 [Tulasnella calospora MUT 4182]|uniref:Protein kinase domain-containing protein n=1 Tax=Tulasnella calospora MUT 4182 TaxID=1051891 RepID=A0A0C3QE16_9AGAM|nr:hypothetical protein M407DRAFT_26606 [Tulasnella calospora MUT 4182]